MSESGDVNAVTTTMIDGLAFMRSSRDNLLALNDVPPRFLYHYSVTEPVVSILEKNELWATNAVFMNDESEIRYAANTLRQILKDVANDPEFISVDVENLSRALTPLERVLANLHSYVEVFVACFSSEQDQLSQWRAYGQSGGLSIGFDSSGLRKLIDDQPGNLALVQVSYDDTENSRRIYALVKSWLAMYLESLHKDARTKPHVEAMLFAQSFALHAISIKDNAFAEEKEWRLVWVRPRFPHTLPEEPFEINFRVANGMAVPYIRLQSHDSEGNAVRLPIVSVRVGPHKYPDLAASGIWHLIEREGLSQFIVIDFSRTPLRT